MYIDIWGDVNLYFGTLGASWRLTFFLSLSDLSLCPSVSPVADWLLLKFAPTPPADSVFCIPPTDNVFAFGHQNCRNVLVTHGHLYLPQEIVLTFASVPYFRKIEPFVFGEKIGHYNRRISYWTKYVSRMKRI